MKSEFKKQLVPDRVLPRLNILLFSYSANGKLQSKEVELTKSLEDIENMKACVKSVESELEQVSTKSAKKDESSSCTNCDETEKRSENMEKIQKQLHEELLTR